MTNLAGLERDAAGLTRALETIQAVERAGAAEPTVLNMTASAKLIAAAALVRQESRGAHFRSDFPKLASEARRSFLTLAEAETIAAGAASNASRPAARL